MSNTSPVEPCPPDGAAVAMSPFILLEPLHESDLSKQLAPKTSVEQDDSPRTSSNSKVSAVVDQDSIESVPDHHLPPRPELQELAEAAEITQASPEAGSDEKRDSRISFSSSSDDTPMPASRYPPVHLSRRRGHPAPPSLPSQKHPMMILWYLLCIVTAGFWFIIDNWANNKFWIRWNTTPTSLKEGQKSSRNKDKLIRIKSKHAEIDILPLKRVTFPTPMPISDVFRPVFESRTVLPKMLQLLLTLTFNLLLKAFMATSKSFTTLMFWNTALPPSSAPIHGKFYLLAAWRDPSWGSTSSLASTGLAADTIRDRQALFGENQVSVKGKSVVDILVEEVLHPFYIFQIYSIILWCNDDYVPYALSLVWSPSLVLSPPPSPRKQPSSGLRR